MSSRQNDSHLVLDSLIFGLQRNGGISRYWYHILDGITDTDAFKRFDILIDTDRCNPWGKRFIERAAGRPRVRLHLARENRLSRYFAPRLPPSVTPSPIFHSSYYRVQRRAAANVVTIHDFTYERTFTGVRAWVHRWQKGNAISNQFHLICTSRATLKDLLEFHPAIEEKRVHIIYHGVDPAFYSPALDAPRPTGNDVVFVGERGGYKNFTAAVHGVAAVPTCRLVMVGKPLSSGEQSLLDNELPGRYSVRAGVNDAELAAIYRGSMALLYPSSYEGFGMPVLEAMASGCPVIARNATSIPEVAGDAALLLETGTPAEIADALRALAEQPILRSRLRTLGQIQAGRFTWEDSVRRYLAVYEHALSKPTASTS